MSLIDVLTGFRPVRKPQPRNVTSNGATEMHLIHEALSRARMRRPQAGRSTTSTEATRSARSIALTARRTAARESGLDL
jgi:hypothetical protein